MSLHFSILIDIPPEAFPVGSTLLLDLKAKCLKNEKISPPGKKNYITSINSKSNSTNIMVIEYSRIPLKHQTLPFSSELSLSSLESAQESESSFCFLRFERLPIFIKGNIQKYLQQNFQTYRHITYFVYKFPKNCRSIALPFSLSSSS